MHSGSSMYSRTKSLKHTSRSLALAVQISLSGLSCTEPPMGIAALDLQRKRAISQLRSRLYMHDHNFLRHNRLALVPFQRHFLGFIVMQSPVFVRELFDGFVVDHFQRALEDMHLPKPATPPPNHY